jgi:hypothetical protein
MPSPSDSNPKRDRRLYAQDRDRFAHRAVRYCADPNRTQFEANQLMQDAVLRNIELIGEAATRIPEEQPGRAGMRRPLDPPEGVLWHQSSASDLLFITLGKSEAPPFSPSTRTSGLALGPSLFHWESQSSAGRARSPSRLCASELRGTRAMRASG